MERAGQPRHRSHNPMGEGERAGGDRINPSSGGSEDRSQGLNPMRGFAGGGGKAGGSIMSITRCKITLPLVHRQCARLWIAAARHDCNDDGFMDIESLFKFLFQRCEFLGQVSFVAEQRAHFEKCSHNKH
jgi:hypothetical protein